VNRVNNQEAPSAAELAYPVTVLELHELCYTLVLVHPIVVGGDAFPVNRGLEFVSTVITVDALWFLSVTSTEHFATASANFSIGLVLPGMVVVKNGVAPKNCSLWVAFDIYLWYNI
jgi:hypothetical protein